MWRTGLASRSVVRIAWNARFVCTVVQRFTITAVMSKLKDFWRSQAVAYTVKLAIFRKPCNIFIDTLLLQTTKWKWLMVYRIAAIPKTLSNLQGHSTIVSFFKLDFFCTVVQRLTLLQLTQRVARSLCDSWTSFISARQRTRLQSNYCDTRLVFFWAATQ